MGKLTTGSLAIIVTGIVVVFGFIAVIIITGNDVNTYIGSITNLLAVTGIGTLLSQKVEKVQKQTNGTLSAKEKKIAELQEKLDTYHRAEGTTPMEVPSGE